MRVTVIKKYGIETINLPEIVFGDFWLNYKDSKGQTQKLINIKSEQNKWKIISDKDISVISDGHEVDSVFLSIYNYFYLKLKVGSEYIILYCEPFYRENLHEIGISNNSKITVGNGNDANIIINNKMLTEKCFDLEYDNYQWKINNVDFKVPIFINERVFLNNQLKYGDEIFILGITIILMKNFLIVNAPKDKISYNGNMFVEYNKPLLEQKAYTDESDVELYSKEDYFFSSPRLKTGIKEIEIDIDAPPVKETDKDKPFIYTFGPMVTMGMVAAVTGFTAISGMASGDKTFKSALPSLAIAVSMLATTILWPLLSKRYEARMKETRERKRKGRYLQYLTSYRDFILNHVATQSTILKENYVSAIEYANTIMNKPNSLWKIKLKSPDFLTLRLGLGNLPIFANIKYPDNHFSLEDDDLRKTLNQMINEVDELHDVPITTSLVEKNILGIISANAPDKGFIDSLIVQMIAQSDYSDLKIAFFTDEQKSKKWEYVKNTPHCWDNEKTIRFFAQNQDQYKEVSFYLEQVFHSRKYREDGEQLYESKADYRSYSSYYVIVTDSYSSIKDLEVIKNILKQETNIGFSLIILTENLTSLPKECNNFIYADRATAGMFESELLFDNQKKFQLEYIDNIDLYSLATKLSNMPIEFEEGVKNLPKMLGFLEMYQVGKVEQLNSSNRWKTNNPIISLQAPLGATQNGEIFQLDLHEKFHGPHGLIAGMTGSGKSELIITYILSMAVNYSPDEVRFILIDYKGGGLAGVFNQPSNGIVLPHLAGTITNLDAIEMNRALTSIQSELRKRQKQFNDARDRLGESSIDIYKYQKFYREGKLDKPIPHLFIICDEFAELKTQQPEFMQQLISTARIGRSLGVHLILATQKPSGIVDDQIWSNSKFRICLKVQEKSDSIDVIKTPDAAALKDVGRFYLQVGYNDLFLMGQSAWCGGQYIPTDKPKRKTDKSLAFIDDVGNVIKSIDNDKNINHATSNGEEIENVLKYLINVANKENVKSENLWLDKIPNKIYVTNLKKKYHYKKDSSIINPIIGEFDDPLNQRQNYLTLPLTEEGNTVIYGSPGSGKENLLETIIYSTIIDHSAKDVVFYIMDFGAEILKVFKDAPQIGDIILSNDTEKLKNLFKMLQEELELRKKVLSENSYDFKSYVKKNKSFPLMVVVLNNYEAFYEMYEENYNNILIQLSREGSRYGIVFILSTSGANTIRYKLQQNFKQSLVLQFNDQTDYMSLLGNTNGIYPSKILGRGLIKLDNIYEFQSAYAYEPEELNDYLKVVCKRLREIATNYAKPVPTLPEIVSYDVLDKTNMQIEAFPVGINEQELVPELYNFINNPATIITALDLLNMKQFINSLLIGFEKKDISCVVYDFEKVLSTNISSHYYNENLSNMINKLDLYINKMVTGINEKTIDESTLTNIKPLVCVVVGLDKFIKKSEIKDISLFMNNIKEWGRINFIFVDTQDKFKIYEYESWYKSIFDNSEGIWIGAGAADQNIIKITKNLRGLDDDILNSFGYVVHRGSHKKIKLIDFDTSVLKKDEEEIEEII